MSPAPASFRVEANSAVGIRHFDLLEVVETLYGLVAPGIGCSGSGFPALHRPLAQTVCYLKASTVCMIARHHNSETVAVLAVEPVEGMFELKVQAVVAVGCNHTEIGPVAAQAARRAGSLL